MEPAPRARPRLPFLLGTGALVLLAGLGLGLGGADLRAVAEAGLAAVRAAGPWWYFSAMALIPLPLAWFTVPAGEAFAAQMTLPGVIAAGAAAVAVQQAFAYWVSRYVLRPAIAGMLRRRGHTVPEVTGENALSVALLVRLTPGPPMIVGSCVLALAATPFRLYLLVSWLVALPWVVAGVMLGRGLFQGNVTLVATGVALLAAAVVAARLWRRRRK